MNFRIKNYINILNDIVDESVNSFIVEREYLEFISLLKLYINSQKSNSNIVHLIYNSSNSILLDENNSKIELDDSIFNAKYLSDISFSKNEYILKLPGHKKIIYIGDTSNLSNKKIYSLFLVFII